MNESTCEVPRCPDPVEARDMCRKHYQRWYRHGDPLALMRPPRTGGIYRISGPDGRIYIGSAENLRRRWNCHKALLRRGSHHNRLLQADWTEAGEAAFTFAVVEEVVDVAALITVEQRWLDEALAAGVAYNIAMSTRSPARGSTHTPEARGKMSASIRAAMTPERRAGKSRRVQGSMNPGSKLTEGAVLAICDRLLDGAHPVQVAADLGVTQETVYQIRCGTTWKHVVPTETVTAMLAIRQNPNANRVVDDMRRALGAAVGNSNKGRKLPPERVAQMSAKARGAGNPKAKLTEADVREIKRRLAAGERNKDLAAEFGVHPNSIAKIKSGEVWAHIT